MLDLSKLSLDSNIPTDIPTKVEHRQIFVEIASTKKAQMLLKVKIGLGTCLMIL